MAGHHVAWLPTAEPEMAVVDRILELIETIPAARIARLLNDEGVPSPKAGRLRDGIEIPNSGLWTQNTVKNIATHPLLIACWQYGRRAMGDQLRLTPTGPRALGDDDYRADGRPRTVTNPTEGMIRTPARFDPVISDERHRSILRVLEERGSHLKGKPRTRRDTANPLGGRIHDLNCGWPMYRHARRGRWGYQCALYQNSEARFCSHNVVGGEAATAFVMACLRQRVLTPSAMAKLEARLREMAVAESGDGKARKRTETDRSRLAALERKLATVGRNMALAETPEERAVTAGVYRELLEEADHLRSRVEAQRPAESPRSIEREVEAALSGLGRLKSLSRSEGDQAAVAELFRRLDVKLYLRFQGVDWGRRKVNEVGGGVVTFGATPPPASLYDGPTDRAIVRQMLASGEPVSPVANQVVPDHVMAGPEANWSAIVPRGTSRCSGPVR